MPRLVGSSSAPSSGVAGKPDYYPRAGIIKGDLFNYSALGSTDIFTTALSPTQTPSIFRIHIASDTSVVLTMKRTNGGVTVDENLNSGNALVADACYIFDVIVDAGDTINFQIDAAATISSCRVVEVANMGA